MKHVNGMKSHSLWVRGLKYVEVQNLDTNFLVALLVSAWIEIKALARVIEVDLSSHSLWVRGLKYLEGSKATQPEAVALLVSAWIEIQ